MSSSPDPSGPPRPTSSDSPPDSPPDSSYAGEGHRSDSALHPGAPEERPREALSYDTSSQDYAGISSTGIEDEHDLRAAKDFAEMIVDTVREALLVLEPDLTVKAANESFFNLFEVRPEEVIGRRVYDLGGGQWNIPALSTLLEDILPEHKVFSDYEVAHDFAGVGHRVMLLNARRLDHHDFVLLAIEDVTARRGVERALRESEEKYRALFNEMDEAFAVVEVIPDEEGRWVDFLFHDANPAFVEHTGMAYPVGRTASELLGTPNPQWAETYGLVAETGEGVRVEMPEDTLGRIFDLNIFRMGGPGSRRVAVLFTDVTGRKRTEEALRESEERFHAVVDLVPDLLWRSDPDGAMTWYNQRWMEYTGQTSEEAKGWGWMEVIHPEDRERSDANLARAVETGEPLEQELRLRSRDGTYRWFLIRAMPVREGAGHVQHWFGSATDVHEKHAAQELLEARVRERTRQVRRLASTLTMAEQEERHRIARILHDDLQQVLFAMNLKLAIARQNFRRGDDAGGLDTMDALAEQVKRAGYITRTLTVDLSPPILKTEGLTDALDWLKVQMRELHGLEVEIVAEESFRTPEEDLRVLLFQIVRELLFNVVKHAETDRATVTLRRVDHHVEITVEDEGKGFDAAAAEAREAAGEEPTGFGLFGVRERLDLFGGEMRIESAPGEGTRVVMDVPLRLE